MMAGIRPFSLNVRFSIFISPPVSLSPGQRRGGGFFRRGAPPLLNSPFKGEGSFVLLTPSPFIPLPLSKGKGELVVEEGLRPS